MRWLWRSCSCCAAWRSCGAKCAVCLGRMSCVDRGFRRPRHVDASTQTPIPGDARWRCGVRSPLESEWKHCENCSTSPTLIWMASVECPPPRRSFAPASWDFGPTEKPKPPTSVLVLKKQVQFTSPPISNKGRRYERNKDATNVAPGLTTGNKKLNL